MQETHEICKKHQILIENKAKHGKLCKSDQNKLLLIERALPTLDSVNLFLSKGIIHKVGMRSALGVKGDPEWVELFSLDEMMQLTPVKSNEFTQGLGVQAEFTKD